MLNLTDGTVAYEGEEELINENEGKNFERCGQSGSHKNLILYSDDEGNDYYVYECDEVPREDYKIQILQENLDEYNSGHDNREDDMTLREYAESESENDPNFWRWLFDCDDFDECPSEEVFNEFLENL